MDLLSPEPGLVIWSGATFLVLVFVLGKFAWNPMLGAIKEREDKIESALKAAAAAEQEYKKIEEAKAKMEAESRLEREKILKEARAMKDSIIEEARQQAIAAAEKVSADARAQIAKETADAKAELKKQVAKLSVEIAGRILAEDLQTTGKQEKLIEKYLNESNFN